MSDVRSEERAVRYYCTAGNGMEVFLMEEVKRKLAAEDVCRMPGKVLFSSSVEIHRVSELKTAERLFLLLKEDSPLKLSAHTSPAKATSLLHSRLLHDRNQWTCAVMTWFRLQGELADSKTTLKNPSAAQGVTMREEEDIKGNGAWVKFTTELSKSTEHQKEDKRRSEEPESGKHNGTHTLGKKRKREEEERNSEGMDPQVEKNAEESEKSSEVRTAMTEGLSSCGKNGSHGSDKGLLCSCTKLQHRVEGNRMDDTAALENVKTTEEEERINWKGCWRDPQLPSCISFRISCKCTGSLSRCLTSQEVSRVIGVGLSKLLGWKVDLKNPTVEINVNLSDDHCLLGIPLTRLPLANRTYIKTTGLRSTVAWAMASLVQIQPGFCVVDPMCGVGTILIEAARENEAVCFLGMDIDEGQLLKAGQNVSFAGLENRIHLLRASSLALPLAASSVNAVICDLPFGRKFSTRADMAASLPLILTEMERVLRPGGVLVLLLSPQLSCLLKKLLMHEDSGPSSHKEAEPQTGKQRCPSPSASPTKQQSSQIHPEIKSKPARAPEPQTELQPTASSLKHQATFRVSLGAIDGLIHKYVKTGS
uniref:THUMP domain-containing protein n=2 Tax=Salarias fasciatus TaxID=181472 RepID=A0A672HS67_SALFA